MGVTDRDGFGPDRGREEAYVAYSVSEHLQISSLLHNS